jgi:hypothetical protein
MEYSVPQLWIGFHSPRKNAASKTWAPRRRANKKSLRNILPGLGSRGQQFLRDVLVLHDGTLIRLEVGDRIANPASPSSRGDISRRKVAVFMFVLSEAGDPGYMLEYKGVVRVELKFPGKLGLASVGIDPSFGDWGYDELPAPE